MNQSNSTLEKSSPTQTCILPCGPLEVRCLWCGDRFRHEVLLTDSVDGRPLLSSIEGSDQDSWPDSPPFQQIVRERIDGTLDTLLGVGMSGRSHWSCSIHYDSVLERIQFDIACRYASKPEFLGSTYRSYLPSVCIDEKRGQWGMSEKLLELEVIDEFSALTTSTSDSLRIRATDFSEKFPATSRWVYTLRWKSVH